MAISRKSTKTQKPFFLVLTPLEINKKYLAKHLAIGYE